MVLILDMETALQCTPGGIPNQDRTLLVPEAGSPVAQAPDLCHHACSTSLDVCLFVTVLLCSPRQSQTHHLPA